MILADGLAGLVESDASGGASGFDEDAVECCLR